VIDNETGGRPIIFKLPIGVDPYPVVVGIGDKGGEVLLQRVRTV
jgi:hypothetical protein